MTLPLKLLLEVLNIPEAVRNYLKYKQLIYSLVWRDFLARFRGSFGGVVWSVIQPLVMMVIYTIVFSSFLKVKFNVTDSPYTFSLYLLCGLLPWTAISEGISSSTAVIRGNQNLVKRVVFPLEILPTNLALVAVIQQIIGFLLLIPLTYLINNNISWTIIYFPLILLGQVLLMIGVNLFWSSLSVYIPDLKQFTGLLLSAIMFLTPIFYPASAIPPQASIILKVNPIAYMIDMYRNIFLQGVSPDMMVLLKVTLISLLIFMLGYVWFMHTKKGFPDIL